MGKLSKEALMIAQFLSNVAGIFELLKFEEVYNQ